MDHIQGSGLRKILNIKWQDIVPNCRVLELEGLTITRTTILSRTRMKWPGHVYRMESTRIPKQCCLVTSDLRADQRCATKTYARTPCSIFRSTQNPRKEWRQIERKRSAIEENRECVKRPPSQILTPLRVVTAAGPAAGLATSYYMTVWQDYNDQEDLRCY